MIDLKNKKVLITGGSGNIGFSLAEAFAEHGSDIILLDIDSKKLFESKKKLLKFHNAECITLPINLEKLESEKSKLTEFLNLTNSLDILINCAALVGTSDLKGWSTNFENQSMIAWRKAMEINLNSVFLLSQICYKYLALSKSPSIINISSTYGLVGPDWKMYEDTNYSNPAAYAASKGGIIQLTKWLAATMAPKVRVNCISPGGVFRNHEEIFHERYKNKTPLNRMATEDDFKGPAIFLGSNMSSYVTGHNLVVDGGFTII